ADQRLGGGIAFKRQRRGEIERGDVVAALERAIGGVRRPLGETAAPHRVGIGIDRRGGGRSGVVRTFGLLRGGRRRGQHEKDKQGNGAQRINPRNGERRRRAARWPAPPPRLAPRLPRTRPRTARRNRPRYAPPRPRKTAPSRPARCRATPPSRPTTRRASGLAGRPEERRVGNERRR